MSDEMIASERVKVERKLFYVDLMENSKGRFLRVTEDVRGRRDRIIIPGSGVQELLGIMTRLVEEFALDEEPVMVSDGRSSGNFDEETDEDRME